MAGMEQLEIHSRDYLIRWINVVGGHTISWSLQPRKKTINFGIFRRDSTSIEQPIAVSASATSLPGTPDASTDTKSKRHASTMTLPDGQNSSVIEKLEKLGMKSVVWTGRCEADRVSTGQYEVPEDGDGMYGMVFDNTYSKQFSKTVTFVSMTYPSNGPPKSGHHMHFAQAIGGNSTGHPGEKRSPKIRARSESNSSLDGDPNRVVLADPRPKSARATESVTSLGGSFYTGVLSKKRRKRNQGYARRFFSLDFTSSTLSYYKNRNSSALRGAIPLSLAAVGADEKNRQISVDSGAEIWLLKAPNQQDFDGWVDALDRASTKQQDAQARPAKTVAGGVTHIQNLAEEREWKQVEELVGRVAGTTEAMRRLAKDTDPKYLPDRKEQRFSDPTSPTESVVDTDYFEMDQKQQDRRPFWRRKSSERAVKPTYQRNTSGQRLAPPSSDPQSSASDTPKPHTSAPSSAPRQEHDVHGHCMQILSDLDAVVASFSSLITQSRQRRAPPRPEPVSRTSLDSLDGQDFYDAKENRDDASSAFYKIGNREPGDESPERHRDDDAVSIDSTSTVSNSDVGHLEDGSRIRAHDLFPSRPHSLYPLPHAPVQRRTTIPPAKGAPPSLISFLRKSVGKDLSRIAMPVTANEPLSLLQRSAETLEHSHLLNAAALIEQQTPAAQARRLLHVAAFAISPLANTRAKERAVRKPFNPMLGETYELVREDLGFRFIGEKVSHRPVRVAFQAEGGPLSPPSSSSSPPSSSSKENGTAPKAAWTHTHSPAPSQKFWGKSAELLIEGRARVRLHDLDENYSWQPPQCFLRNVIAGEKYVDPAGSVTVTEERSGRIAVIKFKSGGMWSGRSEDVLVEAFGGKEEGLRALPLGLAGKWTVSLALTSRDRADETIWTAPPLTSSPSTHYGLTLFASSLNEVTTVEQSHIPPTDSRLRPDQRVYEEGDVDRAEGLKGKLEEAQRRRRKKLEDDGGEWKSRWFERVENMRAGQDDEEFWKFREKGGYWDMREEGNGWEGVDAVFET